jgi:AP-2 complex subunit mu-1
VDTGLQLSCSVSLVSLGLTSCFHRYRTTENVNLPFKVHPVVNEIGRTRVEYKINIKANFSPKLYAHNVVLKIPTPLNSAKVEVKVGAGGKAKYAPSENCIVWK